MGTPPRHPLPACGRLVAPLLRLMSPVLRNEHAVSMATNPTSGGHRDGRAFISTKIWHADGSCIPNVLPHASSLAPRLSDNAESSPALVPSRPSLRGGGSFPAGK